jgi:hypothetical protein
MLVALALLLSFVGRSLRTPAAVVGGVGFGLFIDEIGKFITADNDYFFRPTAAIIYLIFVVLFLISQGMQRRRALGPRERLVNALDLLTESARRRLDDRERTCALELLDGADGEQLVGGVRNLLEETQSVPAPGPGPLARTHERVRAAFAELVERRWFRRALASFFTAWALISLLTLAVFVAAAALQLGGVSGVRLGARANGLSVLEGASLASSLVAGGLVIVGVWRLRGGTRLEAYRLFERALLVQILIGHFFSFLEAQFAAVFGLAIDILLLVTVRYSIGAEQQRLAGQGEPSPSEASVSGQHAPLAPGFEVAPRG